jgi:hypothetical protein
MRRLISYLIKPEVRKDAQAKTKMRRQLSEWRHVCRGERLETGNQVRLALISGDPGGFQKLRWEDLALRFGDHNLIYRRRRSLAITFRPIRLGYGSAHTPLIAVYLYLLIMIGCLNLYIW